MAGPKSTSTFDSKHEFNLYTTLIKRVDDHRKRVDCKPVNQEEDLSKLLRIAVGLADGALKTDWGAWAMGRIAIDFDNEVKGGKHFNKSQVMAEHEAKKARPALSKTLWTQYILENFMEYVGEDVAAAFSAQPQRDDNAVYLNSKVSKSRQTHSAPRSS